MSRKKGFNTYVVEGNTIKFEIINRKNQKFIGLIDLEDLDRLIKYNIRWNVTYASGNDSYYIKSTKYLGIIDGKAKYYPLYLHKFILNADIKKNQFINHKNHNTLDNRKCNLEILTKQKNDLYRKGANKNTTSGERNVAWIKKEKQWYVQFQINKKNTCFGKFEENELDKAIEFAREKRKEIYGEHSKGLEQYL